MRIILALIALLPSILFAANIKTTTGTIDKIQLMGVNYKAYNTNGQAIAFIYMKTLPVSCDNGNGFRRVAITSDHPAFNAVISSALAAKAANQSVRLNI